MHSSPDRAVRIRTLAGDIALCSWARHLTLAVPLHRGASLSTSEFNAGVTLRWTSISSKGEKK